MTTSIFSNSWIGIVFEGRNQQYGAYELRKISDRNTVLAIIFSVVFVTSGVYGIFLNNNGVRQTLKGTVIPYQPDTLVTWTPPPPPENKPVEVQSTQPPPPTPPAPSRQFAVPVIVDDKDFVDTTTIPTQGDFGKTQPGATTQGGDSNATASLPPGKGTFTGIKSNEPFIRVEVMPEFKGGEPAMFQYIKTHVEYPQMAIDNGMEGTVYVQFVVDRDGSLTDIVVAKGPYQCLNEEAVRVVKSMPKWRPGKQNGEAVRVRFVLPIRFALGS